MAPPGKNKEPVFTVVALSEENINASDLVRVFGTVGEACGVASYLNQLLLNYRTTTAEELQAEWDFQLPDSTNVQSAIAGSAGRARQFYAVVVRNDNA